METKKVPEFEVVGLYPLYGLEGEKLICSAHIYIIDYDLDIRGFVVHYFVDKEAEVFVPTATAYDHEDGKPVRYPVFATNNKEFHEKIKEELKKEAKECFKKFSFPKKFPRNYKQYINMGKPNFKVAKKPLKKVEPKFLKKTNERRVLSYSAPKR